MSSKNTVMVVLKCVVTFAPAVAAPALSVWFVDILLGYDQVAVLTRGVESSPRVRAVT